MKVKVKNVSPNPYRNIDHYPLNKEKIMALTKSIETTGFWDNLVGREVDGEVQICYGHHRIEALRLAKGFGYDYEFELPIKNIDDGTMIKIMANENMQEWGHSIVVTDETVKVTKTFLENDTNFFRKKLSASERKTNSISANDIANFLGWKQSKVSSSLKRLNSIEEGTIDAEAVQGLPSETHALQFVSAVEKSNADFTPQEQKKIVKEIVDKGMGMRDVKNIVEVKAFEKKYPQGKEKVEDKQEYARIKKFDKYLEDITERAIELRNELKALEKAKDAIVNYVPNQYINRLNFVSSMEKLTKNITNLLNKLNDEN